jgi:hypothetical protein
MKSKIKRKIRMQTAETCRPGQMVLSPGWGVAIKPRVMLWEPGVQRLERFSEIPVAPRVRRLIWGFIATPLRGSRWIES